jgi:hypothetical protein
MPQLDPKCFSFNWSVYHVNISLDKVSRDCQLQRSGGDSHVSGRSLSDLRDQLESADAPHGRQADALSEVPEHVPADHASADQFATRRAAATGAAAAVATRAETEKTATLRRR